MRTEMADRGGGAGDGNVAYDDPVGDATNFFAPGRASRTWSMFDAQGGRPRLEETSPHLVEAPESLVDPVTRGDPESPAGRPSTRKLASELSRKGFASVQEGRAALYASGYSLQATHKTTEGTSHPDRNAQFEFINERVEEHYARRSGDLRRHERRNSSAISRTRAEEWQPAGEPVPVRVHDFIDKRSRQGDSYHRRGPASNAAWVSGIDHDTLEFAVESIARWWRYMGRWCLPQCHGAAHHGRWGR